MLDQADRLGGSDPEGFAVGSGTRLDQAGGLVERLGCAIALKQEALAISQRTTERLTRDLADLMEMRTFVESLAAKRAL